MSRMCSVPNTLQSISIFITSFALQYSVKVRLVGLNIIIPLYTMIHTGAE